MATASTSTSAPSNNANSISITREGLGRLVATSFDQGRTTCLTTVAHQAPVRLIPLDSTTVSTHGAAVVYLGNYGGGLLPGDVLKYDIHVQPHGRLGLLTQGSNRIYKQPTADYRQTCTRASHARMTARVDQNAFLVVAPDPVTSFAHSAFRQHQKVLLHPTSSLCLIDWFSSGRFANGEQWQQHLLETNTEICILANDDHGDEGASDKNGTNLLYQPVVMDSVSLGLRQRRGMDWGDWQCNAYATMFLYGSRVYSVQERCYKLQKYLLASRTRVREIDVCLSRDENNSTLLQEQEKQQQELVALQNSLTINQVILSITKVAADAPATVAALAKQPLYVMRVVAMSNEDVYRIFHYCLRPLGATNGTSSENAFGLEFYKDRIRAVRSAPVSLQFVPNGNKCNKNKQQSRALEGISNDNRRPPHSEQEKQFIAPLSPLTRAHWSMLLMADSALPTGGFAHSSGLEAAAQLGMLQAKRNVQTFVEASVQSYLQLSGPIVRRVHALVTDSANQQINSNDSLNILVQQVDALNRRFHVAIVSNGPGCMASLDQGNSLLRVALQWANDEASDNEIGESSNGEVINDGARIEVACRLAILRAFQDHFAFQDVHWPVMFGAVSALLGISVDEGGSLLGYCVARDTISAAVRLNLIGPLSSVAMLARAHQAAVSKGWQGESQPTCSIGTSSDHSVMVLSSCAPVLDAIHPCHDMLAVRLFRS